MKIQKSASKSRTASNSNKKQIKTNQLNQKNKEKIQMIENNQNLNLIETIIKTISS